MKDSYQQIFNDLRDDLYELAKRHGSRLLREAATDAARSDLLQEAVKEAREREDDRTESGENSEHEGSGNDLSPAAERVASDLVTKLKSRAKEKR